MNTKNFLKQSNWMLSENQSEGSVKTKLVTGIKFYIKYLILAMILATLVGMLSEACNIKLEHALSSDDFTKTMKEHTLLLLAAVVVFVPLLEETIFRLWQSYNRWHIAIPLFAIAYEILVQLIPNPDPESASSFFHSGYLYLAPVKLIGSAIIASAIFLVPQQKFTDFGKRYGTTCAWISAFAFALMHATNFACPWYGYPFAILCCGPQFVFGTTATYYRRNLGFFYGVGLHVINNALIFIPTYFSDIVQQVS